MTIHLRHSLPDLPEAILAAKRRAARRLSSRTPSRGATVAPWNSRTLVALGSYRSSRSAADESVESHLETTRTDYVTFAATVLNLDQEFEYDDKSGQRVPLILGHLYFPNRAQVNAGVRHPLPFLANGLGVALLVFTDDDKVIVSRRLESSYARPGERDVGVVEGIHTIHDATGGGRLEAGCSAQEVLQRQGLHAKDRWEGKLEVLPADPVVVLSRLQADGAWDLALVCAYLAFCSRLGFAATQKAARIVFGR